VVALGLEDQRVIVAEQRLHARIVALRSSWQAVGASFRSSLTGPAMVGIVALAGMMLGGRSRSQPKQVECKCVNAKPSLLRVLFAAAIGSVMKAAVARGLERLVATYPSTPATDAPSMDTDTESAVT
jgi:hypothetical protein